MTGRKAEARPVTPGHRQRLEAKSWRTRASLPSTLRVDWTTRREAMNQAEALRRAMTELGDVSAEGRTAFMHKNYGVSVRP